MKTKNTRQKNDMTPASLEGKTLGKYRILEPLGRGGMAQVYKAYHPQLDRFVAIKVLRSDLVEEDEFLARFRREARAVAALRHPNIVQVFDFDVQDELYFMVMELMEGNTLKACLNAYRSNNERLPLSDLVCIMNDSLAGLSYAHGEGIIHRDVKSANIMLSKRGNAVLTDFGIAQIIGGTKYTVSGALMGTLSYMAPEQGLEGRCDARSDIYSLGIVYYEALTGTVPFDADTPLAILMKHINDPLPAPHTFNPDVPEVFEKIAYKALAKNPEDRFQNGADMLAALGNASGEAGLDIPDKISLPAKLFTSTERIKPVEIYSGQEKDKIENKEFANGDTAATYPTENARSNTNLYGITQSIRKWFTPKNDIEEVKPRFVKQSVLYSVAAIIIGNILLVWAGGAFGWNIFTHTWPLEILVVGILLTAIMTSLANPWLLIPAGIVTGNGFLLTYFSMTGFWNHWKFLWPIEPILVAVCILGAISLGKKGKQGHWLARRLGMIILVIAVVFFATSLFIGTITTAF